MTDQNGKTTVRGIFTKTLIMGLQGAAAERDINDSAKGVITVASLKNYLINNMKEFISPEFRTDAKVQEPDIDYSPRGKEGRDIIIKEAAISKFPVVIKVPAGATGDVIVMDDQFSPVDERPVAALPADISLDLPRGKYVALVTINNSSRRNVFDVKGIEDLSAKRVVEFTV
jgi:hypothetical protein